MHKIILAFRYFLKRRITHFAVLAVALCVFIVVVVMTVMTGLVDDFKQKNYNFVGDCVVGTESLVGFAYYEEFVNILQQQNDLVQAVSPVIKSYGLLSPRGSTQNRGLEIIGIDPVKHSWVTGFGKTLKYRTSDVSRAFEPSYDPNLLGCILGIDVALRRDVNSHYFFTPSPTRAAFSISCFPLTSRGALSRAGTGLVNTKTFYYSDISQSGLARVDSSLVYLPFEQAQELCGMDRSVKRGVDLATRDAHPGRGDHAVVPGPSSGLSGAGGENSPRNSSAGPWSGGVLGLCRIVPGCEVRAVARPLAVPASEDGTPSCGPHRTPVASHANEFASTARVGRGAQDGPPKACSQQTSPATADQPSQVDRGEDE